MKNERKAKKSVDLSIRLLQCQLQHIIYSITFTDKKETQSLLNKVLNFIRFDFSRIFC